MIEHIKEELKREMRHYMKHDTVCYKGEQISGVNVGKAFRMALKAVKKAQENKMRGLNRLDLFMCYLGRELAGKVHPLAGRMAIQFTYKTIMERLKKLGRK